MRNKLTLGDCSKPTKKGVSHLALQSNIGKRIVITQTRRWWRGECLEIGEHEMPGLTNLKRLLIPEQSTYLCWFLRHHPSQISQAKLSRLYQGVKRDAQGCFKAQHPKGSLRESTVFNFTGVGGVVGGDDVNETASHPFAQSLGILLRTQGWIDFENGIVTGD